MHETSAQNQQPCEICGALCLRAIRQVRGERVIARQHRRRLDPGYIASPAFRARLELARVADWAGKRACPECAQTWFKALNRL